MTELDSELRSLVRRYRVTWETRPELASNGHSVSPIGYVVELSAVPDHPDHESSIACPECRVVEDALERLTHSIAPSEVVHVGRGARQFGLAHDARTEVSATVTVLHRDGGGANRPPDRAEQERLGALLARLRELGAQERHWRDESSAPASQ
jgi:hypothetical protein